MYDSNIYYSPEKFDLAPLAELELSEPDYSFDTLVVWRHTKTGRLYWAHDSGCSCPSPFEDYTSIDMLNELVPANFGDVLTMVEDAMRPDRYSRGANLGEAQNFLRVVRAALEV